jgi:hypothetical protein
VFDGTDLDCVVASVNKEQPIVSDTEAQLFDVTLKFLQISGARLNKAVQSMKNAHGGGLVESTNVGLGLVGPDDLFQAGFL